MSDTVVPGAATVLRPVQRRDHAAVLELNDRNVDLLSPMDEQRLERLLDWADRAEVIEADGEFAGFVMTMAPGSDYDSAHYRAHAEHFGTDFYYLDRIVVDDRFRRHGLAGRAYDEIEAIAAPYGRLVLEVNLEPPNVPSLRFHEARGFRPVSDYPSADGKRVQLLALELPGPRRGRG
ncbi:GNAT family N-acetyltransferase [Nocardioides lentus]|uniref:GNAT family N-acetyltransferase n=1 Tax=Nocardioides lentus TaxID=338077 RepID=A0ABN2P1X9_9ACTN